jgi:hypothetical protein
MANRVGDPARHGGWNLPDWVAKWPTPHGMCVPNKRRAGPSGNELGRAVNQAERMWSTPKAADAERGGRGDLLMQVRGNPSPSGRYRLWPTPASRDYRHPNALPYSQRDGGTKGEQLPNAVGGALNPTWVEWLQGFPLGWTACAPSATPSSRRSPS